MAMEKAYDAAYQLRWFLPLLQGPSRSLLQGPSRSHQNLSLTDKKQTNRSEVSDSRIKRSDGYRNLDTDNANDVRN